MSKFHLIKITLMTLMCASFSTLCLAEPNNPQTQAVTAAQELEPAPVVVKKPASSARTLADPKIDVDDLKLVIQPMTKEDLETEAQAWFLSLRTKVAQHSNAELALRRKNRELAAASGASATTKPTEAETSKIDQKADDAINNIKRQLVNQSTKLSAERSEIIDRLKVILAQLDVLGGDTKAMRAYAEAVSATKIEVSDYSSTLARIKSWAASDEGGIRWAKNIILFFCYLIVSYFISRIVRAAIGRSLTISSSASQLLRGFIIDWSGRVVLFFGLLAGLSALEINLSPLFAAIGAAGLVVGLALQGTLSNLASGLLIMVNKPFDIGDEIEVGDNIKGVVQGVSIFSTRIMTAENTTKIVPNNTIWGGVIVNHSTGEVTPAHARA